MGLVGRERRVLVVDQDKRHLAWIGRIVRMFADRVDTVADVSEAGDLVSYDLVAADYHSLSPEQRVTLFSSARESGGKRHLLIISSQRDEYPQIFRDFEEYGLANLLAKNDEVGAIELIVTVQKILRRDIFGIEKYFSWGIEAVSRAVRSSSEREAIVGEAETYASGLGIHPRLANQFCTVVDEMVTNALYDAPLDRQGRPRFAHLPRTEVVQLDRGEEIRVQFCSDAQVLGVAVTDPFGALSKQVSLDYLARCFARQSRPLESASGGAGLGLYFTFDSLSHLVFNVATRRRTEAIGLMDVRGSYRDFASKSKSFNVFVEDR